MRVCCVLGDEEVDEQIRLRDDVIFQLKQKISDLEHRNKELKELSQIPIKKEGMSTVPAIASACLFGVCVHVLIIHVCVCAYRR